MRRRKQRFTINGKQSNATSHCERFANAFWPRNENRAAILLWYRNGHDNKQCIVYTMYVVKWTQVKRLECIERYTNICKANGLDKHGGFFCNIHKDCSFNGQRAFVMRGFCFFKWRVHFMLYADVSAIACDASSLYPFPSRFRWDF